MGKIKSLGVYGGDYNKVDGTGVRDYIHVVDLAKGHVLKSYKPCKKVYPAPMPLTWVQAREFQY